MYRIIITDFINMLKKPLVFVLMIIGLIAGSFSFVIYYALSTHYTHMLNTIYFQDRCISFLPVDGNREVNNIIFQMLTDESLPEVEIASVISFSNPTYDIIGLYHSHPDLKASGGGAYITYQMQGKKVATVSIDAFVDTLDIGDTIQVGDQNMEVVGLLQPGQYYPDEFDLRRIPPGVADVAGFKIDPSQFITNRPDKAVLIPFDMFSSINVMPNLYTIQFKQEITEQERNKLEELITERTGIQDFIDMSQFQNAFNINQLGQAIIYFLAIVAGMINIFVLYTYFLRINHKIYVLYKMLGATPQRIMGLIIGEMALLNSLCFLVGSTLAILFINNTEILKVSKPITLFELIIIYLFLNVSMIIISSKEIKTIIYKNTKILMTNIKHSKRHNRTIDTKSNYEYSGRFNFCYLLSFRYNRYRIFLVASVAFLSCIAAMTFTYAMSYYYNGNRYERYVDKISNYDISILTMQMEVYSNITLESFQTHINIEETNEMKEYLNIVKEQPNVLGIGSISPHIYFFRDLVEVHKTNVFPDAEEFSARMVNLEFVKYSPTILYQGSWDEFISYDPNDETQVIPCIVPYDLKNKYPLGYEFATYPSFPIGIIDGEYYPGSYQNLLDLRVHERKFKVVGIFDKNSFDYASQNITADNLDIDKYLISFENSDINTIYIPQIKYMDKKPFFRGEICTYIIYCNKESAAEIVNICNEHVIRFGNLVRLQDSVLYSKNLYDNGGGDIYKLHSFVAVMLLIISIGGYSVMIFYDQKRMNGVYYLCGMPWSKVALYMCVGIALDTLLTAIFGSFLGIISASAVREFDQATIIYSLFSGITLVLMVFSLVTVVASVCIYRLHPKSLFFD